MLFVGEILNIYKVKFNFGFRKIQLFKMKLALYPATFFLCFYNLLLCAQTQKPVVEAAKGMVVSTHPVASQVGLEVLKRGGNAIDAAVAVHAALAVVHPAAGNLGGGGFLVYRSAQGEINTLDFREKAPLAASRDMYLDAKGNIQPDKSRIGIFSVGVPGAVDGMVQMHQRYGRLPWKSLIQPSIDLAKNGVVLTNKEARGLQNQQNDFKKYNGKNQYLQGDWKPGDLLVQKDLAKTLSRIAKKGRAGFYSGKTAKLLLEEMRAQGGLIQAKDLASYASVWRQPITFSYKNYRMIGMPPPSSGGIALAQLMKMVEKYPLAQWGPQSDSTIQLMIEAERRVFADRSKWLGDPDFVRVPQKELMDSTYILSRLKDLSFVHATASERIQGGTFPAYESPETTHFSIVDAEGNAVAITTTLNNSYGSKVFVSGAGFLLNDEMDDFSAKPGAPNLYGLIGSKANEIQPAKRMLSSMTPTIVEKEGKLHMVVGTPGGSTIITSVFQVILNALEFHMNMQEAVEYPRFHQQWQPDKTNVEAQRLNEAQLKRLQSKGYVFQSVGGIGLVEGILVLPNGHLQGGADRRGDDTALGY